MWKTKKDMAHRGLEHTTSDTRFPYITTTIENHFCLNVEFELFYKRLLHQKSYPCHVAMNN